MDFFEYVTESFSDLGEMVIEVLPKSPIVWLAQDAEIAKYISYVNWFIPVYSIIGLLEAWLVAVAGWYAVQVILRWIKFTE